MAESLGIFESQETSHSRRWVGKRLEGDSLGPASPRRELGIPWRRPSALSLLGRDLGSPHPGEMGKVLFSFLTHSLADKPIGAFAAGEMRFPAFAFNLALL